MAPSASDLEQKIGAAARLPADKRGETQHVGVGVSLIKAEVNGFLLLLGGETAPMPDGRLVHGGASMDSLVEKPGGHDVTQPPPPGLAHAAPS